MRKYIIIFSILIFLIVTVLIFKMDVPTRKSVTFSIKEFNIENKNTNIQVENLNTKSSPANINNKSVVNYKNSQIKTKAKNLEEEIKKYDSEQNKNKTDKDYSLTISWNQWRSNIVNKILDDSYSIPQLNNYNSGTWFYYSFDIDNDGNISNISIISFSMKPQDIQLVNNLIKSYSHTPLVVFPNHSKRNKINIRAVCLFDNEAQDTQSSDFHDFEHVKS